MKRFYYIAFLILTGFFLTPMQSYACGTDSEKIETSCDKQSDSDVEKEHCCNTEKGQCGEHRKDCDGNCGNPDCHCPASCTNFTIPFFAQLSQTKIIVSKPKFYYQEAYYSSGFLSIWLPPKIG
jgi:hypothetical protein